MAATGFDNLIVIQHDDGTTLLYGHLTHDGAAVSVGERVVQGELLGHSGNTGNTTPTAPPTQLTQTLDQHAALTDAAMPIATSSSLFDREALFAFTSASLHVPVPPPRA